mgnify:CR=1 FL=1
MCWRSASRTAGAPVTSIKISTSSLTLGEEIHKLNDAGHEIVYVEAANQNITNFYLNKEQ